MVGIESYFMDLLGKKEPFFWTILYPNGQCALCPRDRCAPSLVFRNSSELFEGKKDRFEVLGQKTRKVGPIRAEKLLPFPYIVVRLE